VESVGECLHFPSGLRESAKRLLFLTWKIVDDALAVYFDTLSKADKLVLEAVMRRFREQKR
jgi:hypothetical protein